MYILKDEIAGESIGTYSKKRALELAKQRVLYHNSTFCYRYRGKHMPENAECVIDGSRIIVRRKQ